MTRDEEVAWAAALQVISGVRVAHALARAAGLAYAFDANADLTAGSCRRASEPPWGGWERLAVVEPGATEGDAMGLMKRLYDERCAGRPVPAATLRQFAPHLLGEAPPPGPAPLPPREGPQDADSAFRAWAAGESPELVAGALCKAAGEAWRKAVATGSVFRVDWRGGEFRPVAANNPPAPGAAAVLVAAPGSEVGVRARISASLVDLFGLPFGEADRIMDACPALRDGRRQQSLFGD